MLTKTNLLTEYIMRNAGLDEAQAGNKIAGKNINIDGIPAELFQILEDDAVKVLHSICQQIWNPIYIQMSRV